MAKEIGINCASAKDIIGRVRAVSTDWMTYAEAAEVPEIMAFEIDKIIGNN